MAISDQDARRIINALSELCDKWEAQLDEETNRVARILSEAKSDARKAWGTAKRIAEATVDQVQAHLDLADLLKERSVTLRAYAELVEGAAWIASGNTTRGVGAIRSGASQFSGKDWSYDREEIDKCITGYLYDHSLASLQPLARRIESIGESLCRAMHSEGERPEDMLAAYRRIQLDFAEVLQTSSDKTPVVEAVAKDPDQRILTCPKCGIKNRVSFEVAHSRAPVCGKCGADLA